MADGFGAWWNFWTPKLAERTPGFMKNDEAVKCRPQKFRIFINDGLRMHSCSMEIDDLGWNWGSSDLLVPVFVEHVSWQKDRFNLLGVCVGVLD